jgi:hypothetical protein
MPPQLTDEDKKKIENIIKKENIKNQLNKSVHTLNHLSKDIQSLGGINDVTRVAQKLKKLVKTVSEIEQFQKDMKVIETEYSLQPDTSIDKNVLINRLINSTYNNNRRDDKKIEDVEKLVGPILDILGIDSSNDIIQKVARRVNSNFSYIDEMIGLHKMARFLLFIFMFFFIGKTIDYIFDFFDINLEMGYTYFALYTIIFLLFVILPLRKSVFD